MGSRSNMAEQRCLACNSTIKKNQGNKKKSSVVRTVVEE
jgi:hypothetical protein